MSEYIEQSTGGFLREDGANIPNDPANSDYKRMQQEVLDMTSTITPYAGSPGELEDAVNAKQFEVTQEFTTVSLAQGHSVKLADMTVYGQIIEDLDAAALARPELLKLNANAQAAGSAIVLIEVLGNLAAVQSYDVTTDPGWLL